MTDTINTADEIAVSDNPPFRLKFVPLLVVVLLTLVVIYGSSLAAMLGAIFFRLPPPHGPALPWLYSQHGFQLIVGLILIAVVRRFVPADYGLHLPREKTYIGWAILWGVAFGVLMTLVDHAPELIARIKPVLGYPVPSQTATGWLAFEGIYVGPTEEIPFRALLVTYLAASMPGKLHIGRYTMNWAGIIVAVIFALLHAANFDTRAWPEAVGQQIYAFALGVFYAYWLEKSKSIVAPIIGHNVSDVTEYAIVFAWVAFVH